MIGTAKPMIGTVSTPNNLIGTTVLFVPTQTGHLQITFKT